MGYAWLLKAKVVYGDAYGQPFAGNAFTVGQPISAIKPMSTDFNKFTLDKPLPSGLQMNPETGEISGTPTQESPTTEYTVTCEGSGKPSDCKISITVLPKPVEPPQFVFEPSTRSCKQNKEITGWAPKLSGGDPPTEFTILPALPPG